MDAKKIVDRLFTFFVGFGIFIFVGSLVELSMLNHNEEELQILPFIFLPLGILLAFLFLITKGQKTQKILIFGMWVVAIAGIVGMIVHLYGNFEVIMNSYQQMALSQIVKFVIGGRNPLLAPGTLTIGSAMVLAVVYARQAVVLKKK